jgi:hypothetical protein
VDVFEARVGLVPGVDPPVDFALDLRDGVVLLVDAVTKGFEFGHFWVRGSLEMMRLCGLRGCQRFESVS